MTRCHYHVGPHDVLDLEYTLVDQDANGGICGCNMKVLEGSKRFVDVVGLSEHKFNQPRIITAQALVASHKGDMITTFHQMALLGKEYPPLPTYDGIWC
jgi:hypothetical protein